MICPNCKTDNYEGATYCRSCGIPLFTYKKTWWQEHNMEPVGTHKFKRSAWATCVFFLICIILAYFSFMGIVVICLSIGAIFRGESYAWLGPILGIIILCVIFLVSKFLYRSIGYKVFINNNKQKMGLLNTDYIQKYDERKERFVFFARGNSETHKFGLFDVQKLQIKLLPVYNKLTWLEKGKLLSALKDGESSVIDINGKIYK